MTHSASTSEIDQQLQLPLARITAQEIEYVTPLREYLETNGCRVSVNENHTTDHLYDIVAGDFLFVKEILSRSPSNEKKRLVIVYHASDADAKKLTERNIQIVVVDPVRLSTQDVIEIFSFYFTGKDSIYDKRRNIHEAPMVHSSIKSQQPLTDKTRINDIMDEVFKTKEHQTHKTISKPPGRKQKKFHSTIQLAVALFVLLIALPIIWYATSLGVSAASIAMEVHQIKNGNFGGAKRFDAFGKYWIIQGKLSLRIIKIPMTLFKLDSAVRGQERLLSLFSDTSNALTEICIVGQQARETAQTLLAQSTDRAKKNPASTLETIKLSTEKIMESLGLAQAELTALIRDKTFPFMISPVLSYAQKREEDLVSIRETLAYIHNLLMLYPRIAGFREPQTYLLLLQNSNELRATGGFIGSVGIVTFTDGGLSDFSIRDVYELDGQLKGHVDPPKPLKELLGLEHWYLRDSNWDPDYSESAKKAAWFYEKETGETVDGVIAVNVPVVVSLLRATGPILLPDYNERISAENFFGKSFYYTQQGTFAGSTQKSDFLGTLSRALIARITTDSSVNPIAIFKALASGLAMRDILFSFNDIDTQAMVEHFKWAGRIFDNLSCRDPAGTCLVWPVGVFEENVSVSKVNYFIKRESNREIVLAEGGSVSEQLTMTIRNTANLTPAGSERGIGGIYTTYLRFFLPANVNVETLTLDGSTVPTRNPKATIPQVPPYIENASAPAAAKGIGVALTVPPGERRVVTISYRYTNPLPFVRGVTSLRLLYYKHPGISDEVNTTQVMYPVGWNVSQERNSHPHISAFLIPSNNPSNSFIAKPGQLTYNSTILQDQDVVLHITQ